MDVDERDEETERDSMGRNTEPADTVCTHKHTHINFWMNRK